MKENEVMPFALTQMDVGLANRVKEGRWKRQICAVTYVESKTMVPESLSRKVVALIVGCLVAYVVSVIAIKFLMGFVKRHSFSAFGIYRIALAALMAILLIVGIA